MLRKLQELQLLKAIVTLSKNPDQTGEVFSILDSIARSLPDSERKKYGDIFLSYLGFKELYMAKQHPDMPYEIDQLLLLPENTLGHHYARHMRDNNLNPEFYPEVKGNSPLQFARLRLLKTHDILHTISGFNTSHAGELGLQAFYLAQFPASPFPVAILASGFLGLLQSKNFNERGEVMEHISKGYERGKAAKPILFRKWEDDWESDIEGLRNNLNITLRP